MGRLIDEIEIYKRLRPKVDNGTLDDIMLDIPTVLTIPDNPTNGDMIKALFPNFKFNEEWKATRHFELQSEQGHIEITGIATSDWWNAPYKGAEHD